MKKQKKKGYLLLEILICIFLFSVFIFIISFFLKRVTLIEKVKKNSQDIYENVYFVLDKTTIDIKSRDRENFSYNGFNGNFYFNQNFLIFRKNKIYYKLEITNKNLYISDSIDGINFGNKVVIGKYDSIKIEKIENIIKINILYKGENTIKIVNLR